LNEAWSQAVSFDSVVQLMNHLDLLPGMFC